MSTVVPCKRKRCQVETTTNSVFFNLDLTAHVLSFLTYNDKHLIREVSFTLWQAGFLSTCLKNMVKMEALMEALFAYMGTTRDLHRIQRAVLAHVPKIRKMKIHVPTDKIHDVGEVYSTRRKEFLQKLLSLRMLSVRVVNMSVGLTAYSPCGSRIVTSTCKNKLTCDDKLIVS